MDYILSRKNVEMFFKNTNEMIIDLFLAFIKGYEVMISANVETAIDDKYCGDYNDLFIYHTEDGVNHEDRYEDVPREELEILLSIFRSEGYVFSEIKKNECWNTYTVSFKK